MTEPRPRFGVCTIRVEVQPEHLLVTLTATRFLGPGGRRAVPGRPEHFASADGALLAAAEFLDSFAPAEEHDQP